MAINARTNAVRILLVDLKCLRKKAGDGKREFVKTKNLLAIDMNGDWNNWILVGDDLNQLRVLSRKRKALARGTTLRFWGRVGAYAALPPHSAESLLLSGQLPSLVFPEAQPQEKVP